jgi:tetraacyldisaccharide 4'-kinase
MAAWLEREWERLGGGALVLLPFTLVFWLASSFRRLLYRARVLRTWRSPVPVIVVDTLNGFTVGSCVFGDFTPYVSPRA